MIMPERPVRFKRLETASYGTNAYIITGLPAAVR
jgi:hypothetical protein